jgi:predicted acyl esterase
VDCSAFDLWGNGWTFKKGHSIVLEVTQADTPTFRRDNFPTSLSFAAATLEIPTTGGALRRDFRD